MGRTRSVQPALTFLDLFSGCGGFTLGLERAGLRCLAAIDFNAEAIQTFRHNFPNVPHVLHQDLTRYPPAELAAALVAPPLVVPPLGGGAGVQPSGCPVPRSPSTAATNHRPLTTDNPPLIDVIVGGPPCQGFSNVRQVDGANTGPRLVPDPRRHLYQEFLRYVDFFRPKVFVMENVPGIRSASGGEYFTRVQSESRALGYRVHSQTEKAWELGVPQKRQRQLIIGTRADLPHYFPSQLQPAPRVGLIDADDFVSLGEAIGDLPPVRVGQGDEARNYDMVRRQRHAETYGRRYLDAVLEIDRAQKLTAHRARTHSPRDLRDFAKLREGENCKEAMRRGIKFQFPYDKGTFKDRYTRQSRWELCSTIVAHLSKDGLMFIHPTQNRSLTPREAARLQTFPDWFEFPVARTHQFRVIGNAVPPLVSESIGIAISEYLEETMTQPLKFFLSPLPRTEQEAFSWLVPLLDLDRAALRRRPIEEFKRGWYAIGFIYAGLHPDGALDHGEVVIESLDDPAAERAPDKRLSVPYYERSGWPVVLAPIAAEAARRFEAGELDDHEFYCSEANIAGYCFRNPYLAQQVAMEREKLPA